MIATLEILKTQRNKFTFINHVHCRRWCLKKTPAIHETTQDNPKHSYKPAPDFELGIFWVCSFRRIQKRIFDPRFARFRGQKEREIRNWICNLGNLSPTRAICTTASQKMTCFLLFDKLCDYTVQNLVVGSSNSDDGTYKTDKERMSASLIQFHSSDFFM